MPGEVKERKARIFRNGRSRAVRIPKEFDFGGDEVTIRQEGANRLVLEPIRRRRTPKEIVEWLRAQPPLDEDFPDIEDFPPEPVDLGADE